MTEDERAIRALIDDWLEGSKRHDTAKVLGLIADDAIFMVPGREPFGKPAFADASEVMANAVFDGSTEIEELHVSGDWAWCRSYLRVSITRPDGVTLSRSGYSLSILRKQDGAWRLARDANLVS